MLFISEFSSYLVGQCIIDKNPFQILRDKHKRYGFSGMLRILRETNSIKALDKKEDIPLSGLLKNHFISYINYLASLGRKTDNSQSSIYILTSFERYLRQHEINDLKEISQKTILEWQEWVGLTTEQQTRKRLTIINGFFNFLIGQKEISNSPMPEIPSYKDRSKPPYIFSKRELKLILEETAKITINDRFMPYRHETYRMVYLLLYTLGLRPKEAVTLQLGNIDFVQNSITICDSKYDKGRVLPFGPRFGLRFKQYLSKNPLLKGVSKTAFIFQHDFPRGNSHLTVRMANKRLKTIIKKLGIITSEASRTPNLYSFRHSFAVHRIERWYREGADVGVKLTLLSAFLGHQDVRASQRYFTMTPERLRLLGEKFEMAYGKSPKLQEH